MGGGRRKIGQCSEKVKYVKKLKIDRYVRPNMRNSSDLVATFIKPAMFTTRYLVLTTNGVQH